MIILIKLFLNSKLDIIRTIKFVKQLFIIQIQKGGKVLLWNQVKSKMEACYSDLVLDIKFISNNIFHKKFQPIVWYVGYKERVECAIYVLPFL